MTTRTRKTHPAVTPERVKELSTLARTIDSREAEGIRQEGRALLLRHRQVGDLIVALKKARLRKGLSLSEVGERSGIGKANLSRLENDQSPNPTLDTLMRYAEAVGVEMRVSLAE